MDFAGLFFKCALALACGALRLKPRERQLALLLAVESFGRGRAGVGLDARKFWERLGGEWRLNELLQMLEAWRRAGWIAADGAAGECRLAPDRLPGWAECFLPTPPEAALPLSGGDHLATVLAGLSQARAAGASAKISQCENFAPRPPLRNFRSGGPGDPVPVPGPNVTNVPTFKRSDVETPKRSTLADCENFAVKLRERVRRFVGEADWDSPQFWNGGLGWRARLFVEEGAALESALNYVSAGLDSGETRLRKTRGALLWDEFQRERHKEGKR